MANANAAFDSLQRAMTLPGGPAPQANSRTRSLALLRLKIADLMNQRKMADYQAGINFDEQMQKPDLLDWAGLGMRGIKTGIDLFKKKPSIWGEEEVSGASTDSPWMSMYLRNGMGA